jgi:peroxiredoxin
MRKTIIATLTAAILGAAGLLMAGEKAKSLKAPDFTLTNFDGKKVSLSDYKGKIVVLEWFNDECPFVRYHYEKVTTMNNIAGRYKDKNVVFLAINSTGHQELAATRKFVEDFKVVHPILDDSAGTVGKAYGAKTALHMFIIGADGFVVYNGAIDNAPMGNIPKGEKLVNYVEKALDELAAGKSVSISETKPYGCSVKYGK